MRKIGWFFLLGVFLISAGWAPGQALDIQARIDEAQPGDVVRVPAGFYEVNLVLKPGVILEGEGAETTVLDGGGRGPVIVAAGGGVVKGFTITGGIEGVKASGALIGIFENIITGNLGSGIRSGGGDSLAINNLIAENRGPAGVDTARAYILAVNNTVRGGEAGFLFWKSPVSRAVNNMIVSSEVGVARDEESLPEFSNNVLSDLAINFQPDEFPGENILEPPVAVSAAPEDESPLRAIGVPVAGVPEELTIGIGAALPAVFSLETYLQAMADFRRPAGGEEPLVEYQLLEEIGVFQVATYFARPEFTVASSTPAARIEDPAAFDRESLDRLIERLVADEPPAVEVWGWGGIEYPWRADRYVMESVFIAPESYFLDPEGRLNFIRETNFARIRVVIPEGYEIETFSPEGEIEPETGAVSIANPNRDLVEVSLILSPL